MRDRTARMRLGNRVKQQYGRGHRSRHHGDADTLHHPRGTKADEVSNYRKEGEGFMEWLRKDGFHKNTYDGSADACRHIIILLLYDTGIRISRHNTPVGNGVCLSFKIKMQERNGMKKLSVIIVSYNVKYYLEQCLISLLWATRDIDSEVIVVDNHSKDGSVEYLRNRFGKSIRIIASNHNLGFAKANNLGIKQSSSEYVLLINPDTIVVEDTISKVLEFMDKNHNSGAAGVRMIKSDGSNAMESRRGTPSPMTAFYKICGLCSLFPKSKRFGRYYMSGISWDEEHEIDIVSGAFCMLRREPLMQVGMLDEDYFMYGEDIDLSYSIQQEGWTNWYLPYTILHYKGESTQKSSFRYIHVFYDAMLIFFRKKYGHLSFLISLPIKTAIIAKATMALVKMVCDNCRDSVGMRSHEDRQQLTYIFIGSAFTLSQCREIAEAKGLDAEYHEGTVGTLPDGHLSLDLPESKPLVIVYDVHAYSYGQIFGIFEKKVTPWITIGTYDNNTRKIITQSEVIFDSQTESND